MDYEAYRSYHAVNLESQTHSASQVELVLVLFDGLLEEIARARGHIEQRRYEQKGDSISKCINILNGLSSALDFEAGGDVVTNLARLYDYCAHKLYQASIELDAEALAEAESLIVKLKGGWVGVRDQHAEA
ncbi:flagellar export chaperone FliS [Chromobacterium sp. ATCC 53434]|nr:flagellar export chaperone FliS [Chromobacterium sp. ATCC 53434]